jgi:hypothetical protein
MIASYGIITGVDNSVTTVIAWRHILIAFRLVGPATRTRSQRRARSESRAVHWDQSPACAAAARPGHRRMRTQIQRQRKEIQSLQRAGISTLPAEVLLARMQATVDSLCVNRDRLWANSG